MKRTVVVTGGSRGIGRAICLAFADSDTNVFFNYFSPADPEGEKKAAEETKKLVEEKGGQAVCESVNVADKNDVASFFKGIIEKTERIDVLANNAGITSDGLLVRMKESQWDAVLDINLKGAFFCMQLAAKQMMKQRSGSIVNIASVVGFSGNPGQANYVASKAGIVGLTKSAAHELAGRNVTVNAVAPGFIETDMTANLPEKVRQAMLATVPLKRGGTPEDVAATVNFLASDAASYITGHTIQVNGGMYM